ncbi:ATP-binding protein, partial [Flexivirga sp.]|uniref:ATP-binding protein n=1 Tax=Flexivirga sp. TaxID=1962927 RepID=UPI003F815924
AWFKIVGNLLSNAYKFTPTGTITVALHRDGQGVTLSVSDTGSGISPEEATGVLERFHQASCRPARGITGTGIGLALVKDLVEAQGGRLQLESNLGSGTTVTVVLPASTRSVEVGNDVPVDAAIDAPQVIGALLQELMPVEMGNRPVAASLEAQAPRVLLVEDNADLRDYLTRLLSSDGWAVSAAPDVSSAFEMTGEPDIILCDVMLPGPSGLDLTRMVRSRGEWASVPVVLLTARSGPGEVAEGLSAGADDYVSKPFQPIELLSRLRAHYELARDRNRQLFDAQDKSSQLEAAIISNRHIGVAIGVLMASEKVTSQEAFDLLRRVSNDTNRKLRDIAEHVAGTGELPEQGAKKRPARRA